MTIHADGRDAETLVTCIRRKSTFVATAAEYKALGERLDDECERVCWTFGLSDWLVTTTQTVHGWVTSAVLTKFEMGEQVLGAVVASKPRESREMAEYECLGLLFTVGES